MSGQPGGAGGGAPHADAGKRLSATAPLGEIGGQGAGAGAGAAVKQPAPQASPPPASLHVPGASAPSMSPVPSPSNAAAVAAASTPSMTDSELKKFRSELRLGDLVDFESERHKHPRTGAPLWFVGEISRIEPSFLLSDDVWVANTTKNESELMSKKSSRLWPPMTKTVSQEAAQQAEQRVAQQHAAMQQAARPVQHAQQHQQAPLQGRPGNLAGATFASMVASAPAGSPNPAANSTPRSVPVGAPGGASVPAGSVASGEGGAASPVPSAAAGGAAGGAKPSVATVPTPSVSNFGKTLQLGDVCDCLDTEQKWRLAEIVGRDHTHVMVHYVDWSPKWDEWIAQTDPRLQPPRTKTDGYTGPANKRPQAIAAATAVGAGGLPVASPVASAPSAAGGAVGGYASSAAPRPAPAAPQPPPRPSYSCLAACSWKRVLSTGLSSKEIQALNDLFAQCCYVQDSYQEVLLGQSSASPAGAGGGAAGGLYNPYGSYGWSAPAPAPVFKHTLSSVNALLDKLEADLVHLRSTLPQEICAFPLQQASAIAVNIRSLILDSEEATRRQLLAAQEEAYMDRLGKRFRIVEVPSDGSCLFSAAGLGQQINQAVVAVAAAAADNKAAPAAAGSADVVTAGEPDGGAAAAADEQQAPPVQVGDVKVEVASNAPTAGEVTADGAASDAASAPAAAAVAQAGEKSVLPSPSSAASASAPSSAVDPLRVLQLLRDANNPQLQQQVAAKCRAAVVEFLRAHCADAGATPDGSGIASEVTPSGDDASWLSKIEAEVQEVLQQESGAGKYSDATSKAVLEELHRREKQQKSGAASSAGAPSSSPLAASSPNADASVSGSVSPSSRIRLAVESYLKVMSNEGIYGTGLELEALSAMMRAPVHVYFRSDSDSDAAAGAGAAAGGSAAAGGGAQAADELKPARVIGEQFSGPPICLAFYMSDKHYNLLVDKTHIPEPPPRPAPAAASVGLSSAAPSAPSAAPSPAPGEEGAAGGSNVEPGQSSSGAPGEEEGAPAAAAAVTPGGPSGGEAEPSSESSAPSEPSAPVLEGEGHGSGSAEHKQAAPAAQAAAHAPGVAGAPASAAPSASGRKSGASSRRGSATSTTTATDMPAFHGSPNTSAPGTPRSTAAAGAGAVHKLASLGSNASASGAAAMLDKAPPPKPAGIKSASNSPSLKGQPGPIPPASAASSSARASGSPALPPAAGAPAAGAPAAGKPIGGDVVALRVQFPNQSHALQVKVGALTPLKDLYSHAYMQDVPVAAATMFQSVTMDGNREWMQISADMTPQDLGLKDYDVIGIRP